MPGASRQRGVAAQLPAAIFRLSFATLLIRGARAARYCAERALVFRVVGVCGDGRKMLAGAEGARRRGREAEGRVARVRVEGSEACKPGGRALAVKGGL